MEKFTKYKLPAKYFGHVSTSADAAEGGAIASNAVVSAGTVISLVEKTIGSGSSAKHYFPGDFLPTGTTVGTALHNFLYAEAAVVDEDIICKVVTNDTYKFMSAFEVGTNFFNPRALLQSNYLTWGFGAPDRLLDQPLVTVHAD